MYYNTLKDSQQKKEEMYTVAHHPDQLLKSILLSYSVALFLSLLNRDNDDVHSHTNGLLARARHRQKEFGNTSCGVFKKAYKIRKAFDQKFKRQQIFWLLKWHFRVFGSAKKFPRKTMWLEKLRVRRCKLGFRGILTKSWTP